MKGYLLEGTAGIILKRDDTFYIYMEVKSSVTTIELNTTQFVPLINKVLDIDALKIYEKVFKKYGKIYPGQISDKIERAIYEIFNQQISSKEKSTSELKNLLKGRKISIVITA